MRGAFGGSHGLGRNSFNGGGGDGMMRTVGSVMRTRINGGGIHDPFPNTSSNNNQTSPTRRSSSSSSSSSSSTKTKNSNNNSLTKNGLSMSCNHGCNVNNCLAIPACAWPTSGTGTSCHNGLCGNDGCSSNDGDIDEDWEFMDHIYGYDSLFGTVPSSHEVQHALFSLQQAFHPLQCNPFAGDEVLSDVEKDTSNQSSTTDKLQRTSARGSELDWVEPSVQHYDQRLAQSGGWGRVYDAFLMLQTEPSVQKMVVSLSSDKAVWDAVLNNETVREIKDTYLNAQQCVVDEAKPLSSKDDMEASNDANSNVLKWIIDHMKGKLMEVLGSIAQFMGNVFNPIDPAKVEQSQGFSEKLQSTFMLTIVVLLIVVVSRGGRP